VLDAGLATYAQNLETVRRLTHPVRDARAGYEQTLDVLRFAKSHSPQTVVKTSLMLGLGERDDEIEEALVDLRAANARFVTPDEFARYRELALGMGFLEVVSGPLVRSSYRAERVLEGNNVGLESTLAAIRDSATASLRC